MNNTQHETIHLAIQEDFSDVLSKYFPNFDGCINPDTWKLLEVFLDETIRQATDPALNCECGYKH